MRPRKRTRTFWARWQRRFVHASPARQSAFVVGCAALVLWGCYCIREGGPWVRETPEHEPPPRVEVDRVIRVRLGGRKPDAPLRLRIASAYEILDTRTGQPLRAGGTAMPDTAISIVASGIKLGDDPLNSSDITIKPAHDAAIVVDNNTYRGHMRMHIEDRQVRLTNHVDLESYLRGVLRGELPRQFHAEAFKAQCIAARTYAVYQKMGTPPARDWDVYDNEGSQMYIGVRGEEAKSDAAVAATTGEIAVFDQNGKEQIFCTYYSSTCGGITQPVRQFKPNDPDVPPLAGNIICTDCYASQHYRWEPLKLSQEEVTKRIVARYPSVKRIGKIIRLRPKDIGSDGRIIRIQMDGATGENETLVGEDFRLCIGGRVLKSTAMAIENGPGYFVFREGKGFGHGCGLCQFGMETKALRGMTYREILSFYYPNSKLKRLY